MNRLKLLQTYGQSVWMDYIRRDIIQNGRLASMIDEDGLRGVTSNQSIFEKAIAESDHYDAAIRRLLRERLSITPYEIYETLMVEDIRMACDVFRPVFEETAGGDGFVSIEVSPKLARDTRGSIAEARRLWNEVGRPNAMVKIPATPEGIPAIEACLAEGLNINITLMFTLRQYEAVAAAFLRGAARCPDPGRLASVASLFVSRMDTMVDTALERLDTPEARALLGMAAIANAKVVYHRFREILSGDTFAVLRRQGVRLQRLLFGSTSTKNPQYSDVKYVEELIGPDTINTMPPQTMAAFRDHGRVRGATTEENFAEAEETLARLKRLNIDLNFVGDKLQQDGVDAFSASLDKLLGSLQGKCHQLAA